MQLVGIHRWLKLADEHGGLAKRSKNGYPTARALLVGIPFVKGPLPRSCDGTVLRW
jgi:hypothetical protein